MVIMSGRYWYVCLPTHGIIMVILVVIGVVVDAMAPLRHQTNSNHHADLTMTRGLFYSHGSILIPAWIGSYIHNKVWYEIIYPFPNFTVLPLKLGNG